MQRLVNHIVHQSGFPRTRDSGDHGQHAQRNGDVDSPEIVSPGARKAQCIFRIYFSSFRAPRNRQFVAQVASGQ